MFDVRKYEIFIEAQILSRHIPEGRKMLHRFVEK